MNILGIGWTGVQTPKSKEMEAKGVEFVGPIESDPDVGVSWTHFKAPDGHLYGLTTIEGHPDLKK